MYNMKQGETTILSHDVLTIIYSSEATYQWRIDKLPPHLYFPNTCDHLLMARLLDLRQERMTARNSMET
jgi:hypothetical protein